MLPHAQHQVSAQDSGLDMKKPVVSTRELPEPLLDSDALAVSRFRD
jgi:hypothetical protein